MLEPTYFEFRQKNYDEFYNFCLRITDKKELAATITDEAFTLLQEQWQTQPSKERSHFMISTIYKAWQEHYEKIRKELLEKFPSYSKYY